MQVSNPAWAFSFMTAVYLISDTHFGHANILGFKRADGSPLRPGFTCVEEMDEHMVECWNSVVRPQDKVYHLGDVVFKSPGLDILKRLNGHKRLVRGNHDIYPTKDYMKYFEEIYGVRVFKEVILSHIPLHFDHMRKVLNVHGHLHSNIVRLPDSRPDPRYRSVCVEMINYTPITLEEALETR